MGLISGRKSEKTYSFPIHLSIIQDDMKISYLECLLKPVDRTVPWKKVLNADRFWGAYFDTLWISATEITVISLLRENGEGMKRTVFCPDLIPDELFFLQNLRHLFFCQAFHLLTLTAEDRSVHARAQVVLMDTNS